MVRAWKVTEEFLSDFLNFAYSPLGLDAYDMYLRTYVCNAEPLRASLIWGMSTYNSLGDVLLKSGVPMGPKGNFKSANVLITTLIFSWL